MMFISGKYGTIQWLFMFTFQTFILVLLSCW